MEGPVETLKSVLASLVGSGHVYQSEYLCMQNQRMELVRMMHIWHQIGWPPSIAVFAFTLNLGVSSKSPIVIFGGFFSAIAVVWFVRFYARYLDREVVRLYPRIVTLELMLDYHFYRNYLRNRGKEERKLIEDCEKTSAQTTTGLWEEVSAKFQAARFPSRRRGHRILNWAAVAISLALALITVYAAWTVCPNPWFMGC